MTRTLRIKRDRLWASLMELKEIGPYVYGAEQHLAGYVEDAQEISAISPTAMVFVAGDNGGISHTPRENSNAEVHADGTEVLANGALRLADQP
jgi:acetylornithine deacetylase/succinyl-diaminopimelate desuccinylase-like protein